MVSLRVRVVDPRAASPELVAAWAALEARALEPNAYLSPHFVLPALQNLDPDANVIALVVEAGDRLVALLVCQVVTGSVALPLPHLVAYRSRHAFLGGLLLDRDCAADALDALLGHIRASRRWHGLELPVTWADGPGAELMHARCRQLGLGSAEWSQSSRAVLFPHADRVRIAASVAGLTKDLRRNARRLEEQGQVSWAIHAGGAVPESAVDTFLALEHDGWKAERGSALRSTLAAERFFRTMVAGFASEGRAVFVELAVDGRVIGASSNFISGDAGFAFKIGWASQFARVSPGVQVELHLLEQMSEHPALAGLGFWDSGAEPGSYVDKLWPGRRPLATLVVGTSWLGRNALELVQRARTLRRERRVVRGEARR